MEDLVARLRERMESAETFRHPDPTVQTLGAQRRLVGRPEDSILVVGFDAGFNSKSTFNDQFKKATETTPRGGPLINT